MTDLLTEQLDYLTGTTEEGTRIPDSPTIAYWRGLLEASGCIALYGLDYRVPRLTMRATRPVLRRFLDAVGLSHEPISAGSNSDEVRLRGMNAYLVVCDLYSAARVARESFRDIAEDIMMWKPKRKARLNVIEHPVNTGHNSSNNF